MITHHDACLTCRVSKTNKVRFDSDSLNLYWFSVAEVLREFISLILAPRKKKKETKSFFFILTNAVFWQSLPRDNKGAFL